MTPKEKMPLPVQAMPEQEPAIRAHNMNEVALGFTAEMAKNEAARCINCPSKPCIQGCPVAIDIPGFLAKAAEGDFKGALSIIKETSLLPAVCGRVCPQEKQCQKFCTMGKLLKDADKSVGIGRVERFCADYARQQEAVVCAPSTGKRIAVIGSGPASITCAADCAKAGHSVTMFEAFHKCGGVLVYGIPEFRLPKSIVQYEIDGLKKLGVKIETNYCVGRTRKLSDLMTQDGFDAVFVGTGAGLPKFMDIEGENLIGVARQESCGPGRWKRGNGRKPHGIAPGRGKSLSHLSPQRSGNASTKGRDPSRTRRRRGIPHAAKRKAHSRRC